ncbi:MAG: hypothetical protein K0S56_351 [Microvirga sp.]|nr:hypothetical protein [Microvirga sp.]
MAKVTTRIEPIERSIMLAIREGEPPAERGKRLAGYARQALAEAQEINRRATGLVPPHETYVDGRLGAPLESVKPDGVIVFEFDLLNDLFEWVGEMLVKHSPVLTGRYQDSHAFYADGVEIAPGAEVPPAEEYVFLNLQPYARKIERGLSKQAPDGVYEAVTVLARRRFNNVASIRFTYRSPLLGYVPGAANRAERRAMRNQPARQSAIRMERESRQPAIVIRVR